MHGTVSTPFSAMWTLKQLSIDEEMYFSKAASVLRENFYMDDALCGAETSTEYKELGKKFVGILIMTGITLNFFKPCWTIVNSWKRYNLSGAFETKTLGFFLETERVLFLIQCQRESTRFIY